MSNKPKQRKVSSLPPPKQQGQPAATAPARRLTTPLLIGVIVAVAVVVGVVAVLVTRGDDDPGGVAPPSGMVVSANGVATCPDAAAPATDPDAAEISLAPFQADDISKPVAVSGTPLAAFETAGADDAGLCTPAPVVAGYDYAGEELTIDPATDGPTLVVVLAHWCPHCNAEVPVLNAWRDAGDVPAELDVVGLSTAVTEGRDNFPPDEWLERVDWQWPVLADDAEATALNAYGATSFPSMLFIGSDGLLKWRLSGEAPIAEIQARVDEALAAEPA
jgi:cytochrome c biogenesis protein CcmG, thiol:disulfide interchange protein DsbE